MHIPTDQRPCAACGKTTYVTTAVWNFTHGPQCLCVACYTDHWRFTPDGLLEQRRPRRPPVSDLDVAIQRANEDTAERLREASARRWARPGAKEEMSRVRKAYWMKRKAQV